MFINKIKSVLNTIPRLGSFSESTMLSVLRQEYRSLLGEERYQNPLRLNKYGYAVYSQADEDGIIEEIFRKIGETNKRFVEFGVGDGLENNTHSLLLKGWKGSWIDGNKNSIDDIKIKFHDLISSGTLAVRHEFLTAENANEKIGDVEQGEIDLLSIDIDGNDFYILKELAVISPRVIVAEYNATKGPSIDWVMEYNHNHTWSGNDYYGASLKALELLLRTKGYLLVGCSISGVNAFFVKQEMVKEDLFLAPYSSGNHYEPQRKLLRKGIYCGHARDYGKWTSSETLLSQEKDPSG